jgi:hypothetical protein
VHFAGEEQDFNIKSKSKMYTKSHNIPPLPPPDTGLQMVSFEIAIRKLFGHRPRLKSNSFQERLLKKLRKDSNIVFASVDKNLGPVAVTLEQYIRDGLLHLQDESTYKIISPEEAFS